MARPDTITIRDGVVANTVRLSVSRGGYEVFLSRQLFEMLLLIGTAEFGTTPERLFNAIYADAINGGPLTGRKAICVQRVNLNRKLAPLYLRISTGGSGRAGGIYELIALPVSTPV